MWTVEDKADNVIVLRDNNWSATVQSDGCVDVYRTWEGEGERTHICDLASFIKRLIELRAHARIRWGMTWPQ